MRGSGATGPPYETGFLLKEKRKEAGFTLPLSSNCLPLDKCASADGYRAGEEADAWRQNPQGANRPIMMG
jgi:hypothetical protein